jgi:hypothetical protein
MVRKNLPWSGWSSIKPSTRERTRMLKYCGQRCFLGPHKSFPICARNTCKVNKKGIWAAYIRAREWGSRKKRVKPQKHSSNFYRKIAQKTRKMLY